MAKFVFVSGGVVSSLGKGIASASLGAILKSHGYSVSIRKLDPYLNVDPGTMNPLQHGEVFVTNDGGETDLDLGHYERFAGIELSRFDSITSGKIYQKLIEKERRGDYLGATCTVVPHVTDIIKEFIVREQNKYDIIICEIGGTVGDIEGQPFLEAVRQLSREVGDQNFALIHTTLLPYISSANEIKTKPTQHSVKGLMYHGIYPDIILCRTAFKKIPDQDKQKIAMFCNVNKDCVIEAPNVDNIYKIPLIYENNGLGVEVLKKLSLPHDVEPDLSQWDNFVEKMENLKQTISIAIVGKYTSSEDAYRSLVESLHHAAVNLYINLDIKWVDSRSLDSFDSLDVSGIIVAGGFGIDGIDGKLEAIKFARENNIPFLGICLGMQLATIEFMRNVVGVKEAGSTEFCTDSSLVPVVCQMTKWTDSDGKVQFRMSDSDLGGTMRLGSYVANIEKGTLAYDMYGEMLIKERHRHRYEVNAEYKDLIESYGAKFSGTSENGALPEIFEIKSYKDSSGAVFNLDFFIACQFHPEFNSSPFQPNRIFSYFIKHLT